MTSLKLYDFQEESVTKLSKVASGANGDDMGLGKTIQAIEIDRRKREKTGPTFAKRGKPLTLVVAPLSVLDVWRSHFAVWQPQLTVLVINPKDKATFVQSFLKAANSNGKDAGCFVHSVRSVLLDSAGCATLVTTSGSRRTIRNTQRTKQLLQLLGVSEILNASAPPCEQDTSDVSTDSRRKSTTNSLSSKTESVRSVDSSSQLKGARTDRESITVMRQAESGDYSASSAILRSDELIRFLDGLKGLSCTCPPSVFICHWESLRLMPELQKIQWFHVIADEAHRVKNRKAQQTVALKKIPTANKLAMSGTLADNRPDDFWSILNWLYPRTFSSYWRFYNHHVIEVMHNEGWCQACDKQHKRTFKEVIGCAFENELQQEIKPFYVRRLKEDVLKDLPEKYYTKIEVDLTPQQHRAYEEMRRHMLAWVGEHENEPLAAPVVIAQLTRLQQFACAYGQMESVLKRVKVGEDTYEERYVNQLRLTEPSSKLDTVMDLILDNPNEQIVVFAQSKQVINMLGQRLRKHNVPTAIYTGDTPRAGRDRSVEGFQRGDLRVFAGTIAAGGVGITLTAASTVVFLDRAWSPSVNRQAEDRLHRIGQKSAVQIIDLVARGTVDLGRLQKIDLKWKAIKRILGDKVPDDDE